MMNGMPPGGGPGAGGQMAQQLMMLLQQSPKAQQMLTQVIGQLMGQMGMPSGGQIEASMQMPEGAPPMNPGATPMGMEAPGMINEGHDGPEMEGVSPAPEDTEGLEMQDEVTAGPKGQPSTEDELDAVHAAMGDGEPTPEDKEALYAGKISEEEFDAMYGDGAAAKCFAEHEAEGEVEESDEY